MLGWHISVFRCGSRQLRETRGDADAILSILTETNGSSDIPEAADADQRLATWQARRGGINWLALLVSSGRAISTSHGGYPENYLILCRDFMALLNNGLPHESPAWIAGPDDILTDRWLGRTTINHDPLARCDPEEWLLVEAWDES